jgi:hypothetical protein
MWKPQSETNSNPHHHTLPIIKAETKLMNEQIKDVYNKDFRITKMVGAPSQPPLRPSYLGPSVGGGAGGGLNLANIRKSKAINFKNIDLRNSIMRQCKARLRESVVSRRTSKMALGVLISQHPISEEQEIDVIQLFTDKVIDLIKQLIYPVLWRVVVAFYLPAIDSKYLESIKESIIITVTQIFVHGPLAAHLLSLGRFTTFKEELVLAQKQFLNQSQTLEDLGVDKLFRLDYHLDGAYGNEAKIFAKPFREAVKLLH